MLRLSHLLPASSCSRAGLALWIAVAVLVLILAWLANDPYPLSTGTANDTGPGVNGPAPRPTAAGPR
jgi:hypothetical protein